MASVTRSTRRAEGPRHPLQNMEHRLATSTRSQNNINQHGKTTRPKRYLGVPECDYDAPQHKRQRIAVEIPSRLSIHSHPVQPVAASTVTRTPAVVTTVATTPHPNSSNSAPAPAPVPVPVPTTTTRTTTRTTTTTTTTPPTDSLPAALPAPTANHANRQPLTKHKAKVANGLKHELDRLQPSKGVAPIKEPGRKLRSQEATRFKSELSAYFPDYDEVIGNDPKEQHLFNHDAPILSLDPNPIPSHTGPSTKPSSAAPLHRPLDSYQVHGYSDALYTNLFDSQEIDFGFLEARYKGASPQDPMPESYFELAHKKAERVERSVRNAEKGRAQHERDQVVRLLDGLQGHDWLRVMGVSGITETKKKAFEPAREHFIKGCQAILDKFRAWTAEEKRRKLEKDRALAAKAKKEKGGSDLGDEEGELAKRLAVGKEGSSSRKGSVARSTGSTPSCSDVDISAAKQLREEAMAAAKSRSRRAGSGSSTMAPPPAAPPKEFTSFFRKKYQRDAALNKSRRRGRNVLAWGHAIPEMGEREFVLPVELRDVETLRSQARRKRRDMRGKGPKKA